MRLLDGSIVQMPHHRRRLIGSLPGTGTSLSGLNVNLHVCWFPWLCALQFCWDTCAVSFGQGHSCPWTLKTVTQPWKFGRVDWRMQSYVVAACGPGLILKEWFAPLRDNGIKRWGQGWPAVIAWNWSDPAAHESFPQLGQTVKPIGRVLGGGTKVDSIKGLKSHRGHG